MPTLLKTMKKILFALSMLAFVVSALPQARGADVSMDFIYDNLSGGNWIDAEGYGYGWQPDVVVRDPNWRPYSDGYWAYTDYGWTWISYEDFGWATYHYGRWANLADYGWVWFPGEDLDWGPAWVSWRTGGDYIGWAPLPPRGPGVVYEGQPIGGNVDVTFDIGPEYYNFCDVRFIGEPVLRDRIFPRVQNVTYITNTVNVTNIYVQNNIVYNYGPDYTVVNRYSSRPIQRLAIERLVTDADLVIGAVLVPGARAPHLVSGELVKQMRPGSVLVDISIDQGGAFETSHVTTHADPTYLVDDVVHYAVGNMPGAVPRTSTYALTNVTLPYVLEIASSGIEAAVHGDPALGRGVNVWDGRVTNEGVAEAHRLAYAPLPATTGGVSDGS